MSIRVEKVWRLLAVLALGLAGSCNFDSAFDRYCANNPRCADAATGPEAGPEAGPETGPDVGPETGPEVGADLAPDVWSEPPWSPDRDSGPPPRFGQIMSPCASDNDCGRNNVCHPVGKVCMIVCRAASECPAGLDRCEDLPSPGGNPRRVCKCSGTAECQSKLGADFRCSSVDNLCEPSCIPSEHDYCGTLFQPPRVCDTGTEVCQRCGSNADCPSSAKPHCDRDRGCIGCIDDYDCAGRGESQCNSATGACVAPGSSPSP